jgi:hypothetical protein
MNRLLALQNLVYSTRCKIRLKVYNEDYITDWESKFGLPVEGYIEVSGPERIGDVEWLEFDPFIVTRIGRLVSPKVEDVTNEVIRVLQQESIDYHMVEGIIRIDGQQLR